MAATGSVVGLGISWRFPYTSGIYGGGAFLIVYFILVFFIGMVLMSSEFVVEYRSGSTPMWCENIH